MKNDRQSMILQVIEEEMVETQEQLMQLLAQRGFACTQATVSRDIKQLCRTDVGTTAMPCRSRKRG